jgi:hypothetical protein
MAGGDQYKRPKSKQNESVEARSRSGGTIMPKQSKKRKTQAKTYAEQIRLFWDESIASKTDFCFFCGKHMEKRDNIHHLKGSTNDYLLDKIWWVNAHNDCHLFYHRATVEQMQKESWYNDFLERLKLKDIVSYNKQIGKSSKNILFKDEDFE